MNFWNRCPEPRLYRQENIEYLVMKVPEANSLWHRTNHCMKCHDCLIKEHQEGFDKLLDLQYKGFKI